MPNLKVLYRPGSWGDVGVWVDWRLLHLTVEGALLRCYLEGEPNDGLVWQQAAPESLLYCRSSVQGGQVLTVHQGHDTGKAWIVGNGLVRDLGPSRGQNPVGIDLHEAYVVDPVFGRYNRIGLIPQWLPFPSNLPPDSSQGLCDVQPDGTLVWLDLHRAIVISGVTFTYPNVRGSVTVGQIEGGIGAAVGGKVTLVIPGSFCAEPHVAVSPNGNVAICARTDHKPNGAAYVTTTVQELS